MSWFSKPVEYRRYDDGTVEIIERRSFLRIGAAVLLGLGLAGAGAYTFRTPPEMGPESDRSPYVTKQSMVQIIADRDVEAIYRILPHYGHLNAVERYSFWMAGSSLKCFELRPFAEAMNKSETDVRVRQVLATFIDSASDSNR